MLPFRQVAKDPLDEFRQLAVTTVRMTRIFDCLHEANASRQLVRPDGVSFPAELVCQRVDLRVAACTGDHLSKRRQCAPRKPRVLFCHDCSAQREGQREAALWPIRWTALFAVS